MPSRRLDDRIRDLCSTISRTPDAEMDPILMELRILIHAKIEALGRRAAQFVKGERPKERRAA